MFGLALHHDNDDVRLAGANQTRRLRTSKSYNVISPLVGLVRDPLGSVGSVLGGLGEWPDAKLKRETEDLRKKEKEDYETKRQLLYIRLKEVRQRICSAHALFSRGYS